MFRMNEQCVTYKSYYYEQLILYIYTYILCAMCIIYQLTLLVTLFK